MKYPRMGKVLADFRGSEKRTTFITRHGLGVGPQSLLRWEAGEVPTSRVPALLVLAESDLQTVIEVLAEVLGFDDWLPARMTLEEADRAPRCRRVLAMALGCADGEISALCEVLP